MQIITIFLISLGAAFGAFTLWKLSQLIDAPTRKLIFSFLHKRLNYTLVIKRQKGSSDVSVLAAILILLYVTANIVVCTLGISGRAELAKRCGSLFVINMVPLYLGGRTSLIGDKVLHLNLSQYGLLHRWVGRVCVIQGLIHSFINFSVVPGSTWEILLISVVASLGGLSVLYLRRYTYEVFLKLHLVSAIALVGMLWVHVGLRKTLPVICLSISSALWLIHHTIWLIRLCFRNCGSGPANKVTVKSFPYQSDSVQAMQVSIILKKPWKVTPGEYVYLTLPDIARHSGGFFQAHPYSIAWYSQDSITLLIQKCKGFSNALMIMPSQSSAIVDGPYGQMQSLDEFDKVLFVASGVGIAAHLLSAKHLLEAHEDRSARVRRLSLVWFLETSDQEAWASQFLRLLLEMDSRGIFTVALFVPNATQGSTADLQMILPPARNRLFRTDRSLDLPWYVENEWSAEAGNMAISVCGTPTFESAVRKAVRSCQQDIYIFNAGFQPEETAASKLATTRYS